jgi:phospholipid transport system substrate-binding protein|tara:strand:+ start:4383 stop:4985 length:603 start_codon:yes stop_codon:yes gene_type:complete
MSVKLKIIKFLIFLPFLFLSSENSYSQEPKVFIQTTVDKASNILGQSISTDEKIKGLISIAKETVDIKGIGFYTLGKNRKNLSDNQKKEYSELFEKYFLKSFSSRLAEYTDPKIRVDSSEKLNEKYTIVSSVLLASEKRPEVKIDWRIYTKNPDKPLIRDLIIEGLSLARTQKEEFNSILVNNDQNIEALFKSLREFINN